MALTRRLRRRRVEAGAPGAAHDQRRLRGRRGSDDGAADAHAARPAGHDPLPPRRPATGEPLQGRTPLPHRRSPSSAPTSIAAGGLGGEGDDLDDLAAMMDYLRRDDSSQA